MSSFDSCYSFGAKCVERIRPLLEREFQGQALDVAFDGYDGFARKGGDIIIAARSGAALRIECKGERKDRGNIYFEEWSDYLNRPGWAATLQCDVLAYYFDDAETLYLLKWSEVRAWAYNTCGLYEWWPALKSPRIEQRNLTAGRCLPLTRIGAAVGYVRIDVPTGKRDVKSARPKLYAGGLPFEMGDGAR